MRSDDPVEEEGLRRALAQALDRAVSVHILCVGDVMLDLEVECSEGRISPEAPVLVFDETAHRMRLGGAGNVAANIAALGATSLLCAVLGSDDEGRVISDMLAGSGAENYLVTTSSDTRPTTRKMRFVSAGQQLLRIDREVRCPLGPVETAQLLSRLDSVPLPIHAVLLSDYGKGVVTEAVAASAQSLASKARCPVLVDPKGTDWHKYGAVELIKPNAIELAAATGLPCRDDSETAEALCKALHLCAAEAILVTRGDAGASLVDRTSATVRHFPAHRVDVADVCGAGDTNLAVLGTMLASGCGLEVAIQLAQLGSSLAVQCHGNALVSAANLAAMTDRLDDSDTAQILERSQLVSRVRQWQQAGLTVGMTNGCFDLLHSGHIRSLDFLKNRCDRLVVALNSDVSVRRLKGTQRPIIDQANRAALLAGLRGVDAVCLFDEDTPEALIEEVGPDVLSKGGDYDPRTIAGADIVRKRGGTVIINELVEGLSTSAIIDTIRNRSNSGN